MNSATVVNKIYKEIFPERDASFPERDLNEPPTYQKWVEYRDSNLQDEVVGEGEPRNCVLCGEIMFQQLDGDWECQACGNKVD